MCFYWLGVIHLRIWCCIFDKLYMKILANDISKCWEVILSLFPLLVPDPITPCKHTHAERDKERGRQRKWERTLQSGYSWILSKGFVSHYGDLENSPRNWIPLLLPWSKAIQRKTSIPWNEQLSSLLCPFCWPLTEKLVLKFQYSCFR